VRRAGALARGALGCVSLAAAGAVFAACGGGSTPTPSTVPSRPERTTRTTASSTLPVSPAASRCRSSALAVSVGAAGVAAGSVGQVVTFTNRSAKACSLYGFPGLQLLDAAGHPLPTDVVRGQSVTVPSVPLRTVLLAPGGAASFALGYADQTGYGALRCPTSAEVDLTPPGAERPIAVPWRLSAYGGTTEHLRCGVVVVSPVYPGTGRPGA